MAKADLHVHSKYSNRPTDWFLKRLGASQSYTEPEAIYDRAMREGMNYVTITDHNTIEGSLELAEKYPEAFTGVQTTTYFPEDLCKIHLLIYGLSGEQFDEVQRIRRDIYHLRDYLVQQRLAHAVAHATYNINNKLTVEHLERLTVMFDVFESINASMNRPSNDVWYYYLKYLTDESLQALEEKHGLRAQNAESWIKGFIGGSDDHGGIFIGKAYTMANAHSPAGFLESVRKRKSFAKGKSSDFHTLAFTIYKVAHDFSQQKSKPLSLSPLAQLPNIIFGEKAPSLLDKMTAMALRADSGYKRRIGELMEEVRRGGPNDVDQNLDTLFDKVSDIADEMASGAFKTVKDQFSSGDFFQMAKEVSAALPALFLLVPFFTSIRHMNNNRGLLEELKRALPEIPNRKILWFTDTLVDMNGPSVTLKNMGWMFYANGIDVKIVTSLREDEITEELPPNTINLPRILDFDLPYYEQYNIKLPSVLKAMKLLHSQQPDEIFISTPGPVGALGLLMARLLNVRAVGIYHTDFTNELMEITDVDDSAIDTVEQGLRWFYGQMDEVKVPTKQYIDILSRRGLDAEKMSVFPRLIDHDAFRKIPLESLNGDRIARDEGINLLYVGRVSKDKNLEFFVEVYHEVRQQRDDVNLIVTGTGPYLDEMKQKLAAYDNVIFTGRVDHERLPYIYSQGDALIFPSTTDTFGMVVLEAQCCELPAIVSDVGGPMEIVANDESGYVVNALNKEKWVEAILRMVDLVEGDPESYRQMSKRARERVLATYGWETVLRSLTTDVLTPRPQVLQD